MYINMRLTIILIRMVFYVIECFDESLFVCETLIKFYLLTYLLAGLI